MVILLVEMIKMKKNEQRSYGREMMKERETLIVKIIYIYIYDIKFTKKIT
jgi:hypothetical protein